MISSFFQVFNFLIRLIYEILARKSTNQWIEEGKEMREWFKEPLPSFDDIEKKYSEFVKEYKLYEDNLKNINKYLAEYPLSFFSGGTNYTMTLDEIKQKIKEKFNTMKNNGIIISKDAFEKIKNKYFYVPHKDLTRIWGEEYLMSAINKSSYLRKKYAVPNFVIVLDNVKNIRVNLYFGNEFIPVANNLVNASIYFENIIGIPVATSAMVKQDLVPIGYDDFSDSGNIIQEKATGKFYIVDTEYKSFKFPSRPRLNKLLIYAWKKFRYLNNNVSNYVYDIDLEE